MGLEENAPLCCLPRHSLKVIAPTIVFVPAVFISFLNTSLSLASCIHHCTEVACLELNSDFFAKSRNPFSLHFTLPPLPLTQMVSLDHPVLETPSCVFLSSMLFMFHVVLIISKSYFG